MTKKEYCIVCNKIMKINKRGNCENSPYYNLTDEEASKKIHKIGSIRGGEKE